MAKETMPTTDKIRDTFARSANIATAKPSTDSAANHKKDRWNKSIYSMVDKYSMAIDGLAKMGTFLSSSDNCPTTLAMEACASRITSTFVDNSLSASATI